MDFYPYYVFTAVRKFIFFLDPMRKGRIAIKDIVSSPVLRQFNELRQVPSGSKFLSVPLTDRWCQLPSDDQNGMDGHHHAEHDWFSCRAALRIYGAAEPFPRSAHISPLVFIPAATYLNLDVDHNGMLCKSEFAGFNGGSLSNAFVDRLFQEYRMYRSDSQSGRLEMVIPP